MAVQPYYDGPAEVKTDAAGSLATLGYSEDGVQVENQDFTLNVHGDQNGGTDGPPIDVQLLGQIFLIRLTLTKFDWTEAESVLSRTLNGTYGTPPAAGTLVFQDSKAIRTLINPTVRPLNFVRSFVRGSWEVNKGTKHNKLILGIEGHVNGPVDGTNTLWNTSTE